jgi:hypothetical protein
MHSFVTLSLPPFFLFLLIITSRSGGGIVLRRRLLPLPHTRVHLQQLHRKKCARNCFLEVLTCTAVRAPTCGTWWDNEVEFS